MRRAPLHHPTVQRKNKKTGIDLRHALRLRRQAALLQFNPPASVIRKASPQAFASVRTLRM